MLIRQPFYVFRSLGFLKKALHVDLQSIFREVLNKVQSIMSNKNTTLSKRIMFISLKSLVSTKVLNKLMRKVCFR